MSGADGPTPDIEETPLPQKGLTSLSAPQSARLIGTTLTSGGSRAQSHKQEQGAAQILSGSWRPNNRTLPLAAVFSSFPVTRLERVGGV